MGALVATSSAGYRYHSKCAPAGNSPRSLCTWSRTASSSFTSSTSWKRKWDRLSDSAWTKYEITLPFMSWLYEQTIMVAALGHLELGF